MAARYEYDTRVAPFVRTPVAHWCGDVVLFLLLTV